MPSVHGPTYYIKGKIPQSPVLCCTEETPGKHWGGMTTNTKKALEEQSVGLCSSYTQHSPIYFKHHAGEKMLNFSLLLGLRRKYLLYTKWDPDPILGLYAILFWACSQYRNPIQKLTNTSKASHQKNTEKVVMCFVLFCFSWLDSERWKYRHSFWGPVTTSTTKMQPGV